MQYTRLTFFGSRRTADIVLPDDETVGALLPEVLDLLEEPPVIGGAPTLVTTIGATIDPDRSLESQDIAQGTMLRIVADDDIPQSPEIADVTDTAGLVREARRDVWTRTATITAATAGTTIASLYAAWTWTRNDPGVIPFLVTAAILVAAGAVLGARRGAAGPAAVLAGLAAGTATAALAAATPELAPVLRLSVVTGAIWMLIGGVVGAGARRPSAIAGAVIALANAIGVSALTLLVPGADDSLLATLTAVANVILLGFLPGIAAGASGLTRYDDLVIGGVPTSRRDVETAVDDTFAALTWSLVATLPPLALAAHALLTAGGRWGIALGAGVSVVALLRMRMFPLVIQRAVVLVAIALSVGTWFAWTPMLENPTKIAVALTLSAVLLVLTLISPAAVTRARIRRRLGTLELLAVLSILPCALGALGIFGDLFGVFR